MSANDYPDHRKPKVYYFNHSRREPTVIAAPPKPDFGVRTDDGASWREGERYMRWLLPTNGMRAREEAGFWYSKARLG